MFRKKGAKATVVNTTSEMDEPLPEDAVELPITGELDLHTFRPSEIGSLLPDYFAECQQRGILSVRVIHGKGTGVLREGVHRVLERLPMMVRGWTWPAAEPYGGWGATWVQLMPRQDGASSASSSHDECPPP